MTASAEDVKAVAGYGTAAGQAGGTVAFLLNVIPTTFFDAFARGDILQVLLVSTLFGIALLRARRAHGDTRAPSSTRPSQALFVIVGLIMRAAPIGAFGAMAFTVGRYGIGTLLSLGKLMAGVYLTCFLFIVIVLGAILRVVGLGLVKFLRYIAEEILIVLGTSSSESALPRLMVKMEHLGCAKPVVGLVVPAGYSFNLDGTAIYMTMAAVFVAQASGVHLVAEGAALDAGGADADVEGSRGRDRQRLHHARGDAVGGSVDSAGGAGAARRRRSVHVRSRARSPT